MDKKYEPTAAVADRLGVKSDSMRRALCTRGHYLGVKPIKLPNGRLLWPVAEFVAILEGGSNA